MKGNIIIRILKRATHHIIPHKGNAFKPLLFDSEVILGIVSLFMIVYMVFAGNLLLVRHSDFLAAVLPRALSVLANTDRSAHGLTKLVYDEKLAVAAQMKANDMAKRGYFAHTDPNGRQPWYWFDKVGYQYKRAGENLAIDFSESVDVERAWMNSPAHRANILKKQFTHVGIATAKGVYNGHNTTYVVQFFATPVLAQKSKTQNIVHNTQIQPKKTQREKERKIIQPNTGKIAMAKTNNIAKADILGANTEKTQEKVKTKLKKQMELPQIALNKKTKPQETIVLGIETVSNDTYKNSSSTTQKQSKKTKKDIASTTKTVVATAHKTKINGTIATLLSSPSQVFIPVLLIIFTLLLIIVAVSIFMHVRVRTVEEIIGGVVLLVVVGGLLYISTINRSDVVLPDDSRSTQINLSL